MRIGLVIFALTLGSASFAEQPRTIGPDQAQLSALGYDNDEAALKAQGKCPGAEDGHELLGMVATEWTLSDWVNTERLSLAQLRGRVVVVRFWTVGCSFCEKSMPALERLAREFHDRPVTFVGAFHAKPADSVADMSEPAKVAKGWGITFPLAIDREWRTLRSWYLDGHHRHATSATFVIGKDGRVVHVHPGPVFYPTDSPDQAEENRAFEVIRSAIVAALGKVPRHASVHPEAQHLQ